MTMNIHWFNWSKLINLICISYFTMTFSGYLETLHTKKWPTNASVNTQSIWTREKCSNCCCPSVLCVIQKMWAALRWIFDEGARPVNLCHSRLVLSLDADSLNRTFEGCSRANDPERWRSGTLWETVPICSHTTVYKNSSQIQIEATKIKNKRPQIKNQQTNCFRVCSIVHWKATLKLALHLVTLIPLKNVEK